MEKEDYKKISIATIFAIAMAFIETLIVVYLRKIYYPAGFNFPLNPAIEPFIYNIEIIREFFTIVMLICLGLLAGKKSGEKFAYFIYSFAVWDIFYYIWLKALLLWPESIFTWDVLFLIPFPWLGPVIAPIINSLTMIILAFFIIHYQKTDKNLKIIKREWILLIIGSFFILYTYLYDYIKLIFFNGFSGKFFLLLKNPEFLSVVGAYVPDFYNWIFFIIGEILFFIAIYSFYKRNANKDKKRKFYTSILNHKNFNNIYKKRK